MNNKFVNQNRAVQIIEFSSISEFRAKKDVIAAIYNDVRIANLPIIVFCIAGAARKGKSFILNFFVDYLSHMEKHPNEPWELNENTRLAGFEFQEGEDPTTMGIWAWNHIDSQGTFDKNSSFKTCSTIFALTCMFSSIMCFNVFTDLQENKLTDLATFVDHGKRIFDNLGGSGKLFQDLVIIVRDFCHKKYLDDKDGGQKYVEGVLDKVSVSELQETRDGLNSSYERIHGFIFTHPGEKVAMEKTNKIADISPNFVERVKHMVQTLIDQGYPKKVGPTVIRSKDMVEYILQTVKCFNTNPEFAPKAHRALTKRFLVDTEVTQAIEKYNKKMDDGFDYCKTGFENGKLDTLHTTAFEQIEGELSNRIKNDKIKAEIIDKFIQQVEQSFAKYKEKNKLLVEKEKTRLKMIENERAHKEKLAEEKRQREREKAESDRKIADANAEAERKVAKAKDEADQKIADEKAKKKKEITEIKKKHEKEKNNSKNLEIFGDLMKTAIPLAEAAGKAFFNDYTDSSSSNGYTGASREYSGQPPSSSDYIGSIRGGFSNSSRGGYASALSEEYPSSAKFNGGYPSVFNGGYPSSARGGYGYNSNSSNYGPPLPNPSSSRGGCPHRGLPHQYSGSSSYPRAPSRGGQYSKYS